MFSAAYLERVRSCARRLGLRPAASVLTFFDSGLRTQDGEEPYKLPPEAESLYRILRERADTPEHIYSCCTQAQGNRMITR